MSTSWMDYQIAEFVLARALTETVLERWLSAAVDEIHNPQHGCKTQSPECQRALMLRLGWIWEALRLGRIGPLAAPAVARLVNKYRCGVLGESGERRAESGERRAVS